MILSQFTLCLYSQNISQGNNTMLFKNPSLLLYSELNKKENVAYIRNLELVIKNISEEKAPTDSALYFAIPKTESEFIIYFSCDYEIGSVQKSWIALNREVLLAAQNKEKIFLAYLGMAEFVDGYYAESYFDDLEGVISKYHKSFFCSTYSTLSKECQLKLGDMYEDFCE